MKKALFIMLILTGSIFAQKYANIVSVSCGPDIYVKGTDEIFFFRVVVHEVEIYHSLYIEKIQTDSEGFSREVIRSKKLPTDIYKNKPAFYSENARFTIGDWKLPTEVIITYGKDRYLLRFDENIENITLDPYEIH
ncbi:MAG: hypothetical protein AB1394_15650 [Bacteroidota bacterium]